VVGDERGYEEGNDDLVAVFFNFFFFVADAAPK
jgi:hypothetical protein